MDNELILPGNLCNNKFLIKRDFRIQTCIECKVENEKVL